MTCSRQNERLRLFAGLNVRKSRLTASGSENMERTVDALGKEGRGKKKISAQSSSKVRPPSYHGNGNGGQSPVGGLGTTARLPKNVTMATTATVSTKPLIVMVTD